MSKKNILNEAQVRQFMKLAKLGPLTPGFVDGLTERGGRAGDEDNEPGKKGDKDFTSKKEKPGADKRKGAEKRGAEGTKLKQNEPGGRGHKKGDDAYVNEGDELEELRTGRTGALGPGNGTANPGHGRGQGEAADGTLFQEEDEEAQDHDLEDAEHDMDHAEDLEDDASEDLGDVDAGGDDRMVSVEDFLGALESALESALGDEVEVDASEMAADAAEDDFAPEGDDVVADLEVDAELDERQKYGGNKGDESRSRRDYEVDERQKYGGNKGDESRSKRDYVEEGVFGGADKAREKRALGKKGSYAPDPDEGEEEWKGSAPGGEKRTRRRRRASDIGGGGGMKIGGITAESQDDLVEQITKRVAARILKSALSKK